jgi:hypothetical protein
MTFDYNILNLYNADIQIKKQIKKKFKKNNIKKYFFKITFNSVSFTGTGTGRGLDDRGGIITNIYEWLDYFNKLKDEPFHFTKNCYVYTIIHGNPGNPPSYLYLPFGFVKIVDDELVFKICNKLQNKFYSKIPQGRFIHVNFSFHDSF